MASEKLDEKAIFNVARQIPSPDARTIYLQQVCGADGNLLERVNTLLQGYEEQASFLESPPAAGFTPTQAQPPAEKPGTQIGPYKLLQQIGEGGMGTVYMAEQSHPVQRKVALKVIKAGMDSRQVIARFEAERQALAMMDHVNIARVLDAGTIPSPSPLAGEGWGEGVGRPYFVMELVHGVPITKYCDDNHLTPRQRLELFVPVCQAIQHAHQKGIIHRDIKPSNVMVTLYDGKPVPKVIDFGVAKATEQKLTERTLFTQYGTMVGTLEYMSPEQAEMSALGVDTRSDIYSLGVLLYELLTGSTPLSHKRVREAAYGEVLRMIREEEPPKPSTRLSDSGEALASISAQRHTEPAKLSKLMRGELDWIVMKTLEKDRNRRYETANGFAADVQRYLNDEPVQACPPSARYRLRKFARRNKRALATASVVAMAILLAVGTVGWAIRDRDARDEQVAHDREARQAKLAGDLQVALERAELFQDQGKRAEALAAFERAAFLAAEGALDLAMQKRLAALKDRLVAEAQDQDFVARFEEIRLLDQSQVNLEESRFVTDAAISKIRELLRQYGIEVGVTAPGQAVPRIQGRPAAIQGHLLAALEECLIDAQVDAQTRQWFLAVLNVADSNPWRTQLRQATAAGDWQAREQLARQVDVQKHPPSLLLLVAGALRAKSKAASLELLHRIQRAYPADFWANHTLARALAEGGRPAEAVRYYTAALALRPHNPGVYLNRAVALGAAGESDAAVADLQQSLVLAPRYAAALTNLGQLLRKKGDVDGALAACRQAIAIDPQLAMAHYNLLAALHDKGDAQGVLDAANQLLAVHPKLALAHYNLGLALRDNGDVEGEIAAYRQAIAIDPQLANAHKNLGRALLVKGDSDGAIAAFRQAIALDPKEAAAPFNLGNAMMTKGDVEGAITAYRQGIAIDPKHARAHSHLGHALKAKGYVEEAIDAFRQAIALDPKEPNDHNALGTLLLDKKGDVAGAIAAFRQAIALDPKDAKFYFNLGNALDKQGDVEGAIAAFRQAIALDAKDARFFFNLGYALDKKGDTEEAITVYRQAIATDPKYAKAYYSLANALDTKGLWEEAIAVYRETIRVQPSFTRAHEQLAQVLSDCPQPNLRDPGKALEHAKKVVELAQQSTMAWQVLGWVQYRAGNWQASIEALDKSCALQKGGDGGQWIVLALSHGKLATEEDLAAPERDRRQAEARRWYERAARQIDSWGSDPKWRQQRLGQAIWAFRAEAAVLLKIADDHTTKPESK